MNVYFISGLGADKQAFQRIKLSGKFCLHYLPWIPPLKNETLDSYAKRLAELIDKTSPFALVGLSMGGMIAAAMNNFIRPKITVLISSASCSNELPGYFKWSGRLGLYKLIPTSLMNKPNAIAYWLFGAKQPTEKKLMRHIISNGNAGFIKWGIGAILTWKGIKKPTNIFHIHGANDKILPLRNTKPDVVVKEGSHFMVWTKASEVSRLLDEALTARLFIWPPGAA